MSTQHIEQLRKHIEPLRQEIINHKLYSVLSEVSDVRSFMQYHVYAVWDFMSLLKCLQNQLTCTSIPWFPVGNADTRFLINEIVVGEESDVDLDGNRKSHFELYSDAMSQCNADNTAISNLIKELKAGTVLNTALTNAKTPTEASDFVLNTFKTIDTNKAHVQAAVFTFGREDLIPGMFLSLVKDLDKKIPNSISIFKYYLERHIEVDGDHHSHLALQMTENLCGDNAQYWQEATDAVYESLQSRIKLWDGAYNQILLNKEVVA